MNWRIAKKIKQRQGRSYRQRNDYHKQVIKTIRQAVSIDLDLASRKQLERAHNILARELNKTINLYENLLGRVPKTYRDQLDGSSRFKTIYHRGRTFLKDLKENIAIMVQTIEKSEVSTEDKRKEFLEKFRHEITGTVMKKDGTRRKYDIHGSLFRNDIKKYADKITIEQLLKIYDIIDELESDRNYRYAQYKAGDFDAMIVTAVKGYDPTKMSIDEFLDKVHEIKTQRERELDAYVKSKGFTSIFG